MSIQLKLSKNGNHLKLKVGDKVLTPFGIQTIKTIMKHCSSQPGYEWIILVEENENEYKPCELIGIVVKELTLEQWNQIIEQLMSCG